MKWWLHFIVYRCNDGNIIDIKYVAQRKEFYSYPPKYEKCWDRYVDFVVYKQFCTSSGTFMPAGLAFPVYTCHPQGSTPFTPKGVPFKL